MRRHHLDPPGGETLEQARERWHAKNLARPEAPPIIALNQYDRDAAREEFQNMMASLKVNYERRTGHWIDADLNSAELVERLINAINLSRVEQVRDRRHDR